MPSWVERNRQEYQKQKARNERLYGGFDNYRKYNPLPLSEVKNPKDDSFCGTGYERGNDCPDDWLYGGTN